MGSPVLRSTLHCSRVACRDAVWARDGGRCAFVGTHGRCTETAFLEYHHRQPFAAGGKATVENIELRCRAHNAYEARLFFTGDVLRESDIDSFWNELPPLSGQLDRRRDLEPFSERDRVLYADPLNWPLLRQTTSVSRQACEP